MILGSNGIKMGKRFPEYVVNPNDIVNEYGADTLRLYEMFMGPLEADKPWNTEGVKGSRRFIERVYRLFTEFNINDNENKNLEKIYHQTVKKVTIDYENISFNTAISQLMIFVNTCYKEQVLPKEYMEGFLKLFNPVCPHITEELWEMLGHNDTIANATWPTYNDELTKEDTYEMVVQINGKVRGKIILAKDTLKDEMLERAKEIDNVKGYLNGKEIVKEIVVPGKLVNFVVR